MGLRCKGIAKRQGSSPGLVGDLQEAIATKVSSGMYVVFQVRRTTRSETTEWVLRMCVELTV